MGGLITRYALAYMEKNGINHDTWLYISFDSPQRGANISLGTQYWLWYFGECAVQTSAEAKMRWEKQLCSNDAKQMLIYHAEPGDITVVNDLLFTEFYTGLNSLGYPQNLCKVAASCGSGNGLLQLNNDYR